MPISEKFLRRRDPKARARIETDLFCEACGYNLRGLRQGGSCPECSELIRPATAPDLPTAGSMELRLRWRLGLGLASSCIAVAIFARLLLAVVGFRGLSDELIIGYLTVCAINGVLWTTAVWLITPVELDNHWTWAPRVRMLIRFTQPLWLVAFGALAVRHVANLSMSEEAALGAISLLCRLVAGIGAVVTAWLLGRLALEAELSDAKRRLDTAVWIMPVLVPLTLIFPVMMPWYFVVILWLALIGSWWILGTFGLGVLELYRHTSWSIRHGIERQDRTTRVAEQRGELNRRAATQVRPVPPQSGDLPLDASP